MKKYKNENDLSSNIVVLYKNKQYITGNRRHSLVELYKNNKFIVTVPIKEIKGI